MAKQNCVFIILLIGALAYIHAACGSESPPPRSEEYLKKEAFAQKMCGSCHQYTPPELLTRSVWPNVLSGMKMEMKKIGQDPEFKDWIEIQKFYLNNAPQFLSKERITEPLEQTTFVSTPWKSDALYHSRSTMVSFNEKSKVITVGQQNGELVEYTSPQQFTQHVFPNVPIAQSGNHTLGMGTLGPSDQVSGSLYVSSDTGYSPIVSGMNRVIDFQPADLNDDGELAFIISSFGSPNTENNKGHLILAQKTDTAYVKTVLDPLPGATMSKVYDLNGDGKKDIIGLFSQGNEMIRVYYNQGDLKFKAATIITLPPVYGTNSFDVADMDNDGDMDILVTSGDNDDYSQISKPYHGIRIFLNDGSNSFEEDYLYSINGANKVMSADFDLDGDMDFVVLAMYADLFSRPWETLQYFENKGRMRFTPKHFEASPTDNWLVMDIGDIDNDGDMDIMTAANQGIGIRGMRPPALEKLWQETNIGLNVWENKTN